jgi:hypothetical protein
MYHNRYGEKGREIERERESVVVRGVREIVS